MLLCLVLVHEALSQQPYHLSPPDRSFEVTFPAQPKHEQNVSNSGVIRVEGHAYSAENSTSKFILSFAEVTPPPADLTATQALDGAISGTVQNVSGKIVNETSMTISGKPAKAVTISVGQSTVLEGRFVWVKPRVYQLLVLHRRGLTPDFEQRFFNSFAIPK